VQLPSQRRGHPGRRNRGDSIATPPNRYLHRAPRSDT
jgi:hypothetical protein